MVRRLYWCASQDQPDLLTRPVQPVHQAGPGWYEVDSAWVTEFGDTPAGANPAPVGQAAAAPGEAKKPRDNKGKDARARPDAAPAGGAPAAPAASPAGDGAAAPAACSAARSSWPPAYSA